MGHADSCGLQLLLLRPCLPPAMCLRCTAKTLRNLLMRLHRILMPTCRATKRIACRPGVGGAMIPRICDAAALPGQQNNVGGSGVAGQHVVRADMPAISSRPCSQGRVAIPWPTTAAPCRCAMGHLLADQSLACPTVCSAAWTPTSSCPTRPSVWTSRRSRCRCGCGEGGGGAVVAGSSCRCGCPGGGGGACRKQLPADLLHSSSWLLPATI